MNKTFAISVVALFVVSMILGMVVHGMMLHADYSRLMEAGLFRKEGDQQAHFMYMIAAHVVMAVGITWVYRQGRDTRPWPGQGVRFGLALALVATIPTYLIYFAVQPMPSDLVAKQIAFDVVGMVILGLVAAAVNRDAPRARS
jgi:hypothetical protein